MKGALSLILFANVLGSISIAYESAVASNKEERFISPTKAQVKVLRQSFQKQIDKSLAPQYSGYMKDRRTLTEKRTLQKFVRAWSKRDAAVAPFLGSWSEYESVQHIYPSSRKGRVCIIGTGEGHGWFDIGIVTNGLIRTKNSVFFRQGAYLAVAHSARGRLYIAGDLPASNPVLTQVQELRQYLSGDSQETNIVDQFHATGCLDYLS